MYCIRWFANDLKSVDRKETPWIVVGLHRWMYSTKAKSKKSDLAIAAYLRDNIEPLFREYQVNVVLQGHQHSYERTCKLYQSQCTEDNTGPVYVTLGTAGTSLETSGFDPSVGGWSVAHIDAWCVF